jgi:diacylglycerol kinase family enzyme
VKHLFVIDPFSFRGKREKMEHVIDDIHDFFLDYAPDDYEVRISRFPRDASGFIFSMGEALPEDEILRVYAVGNTGILFDCLNGVMHFKNMELASIPYGKPNNFVRGFGKKNIELFRDISRQAAAATIPIDVMSVGGNYALSFCCIGVEPEIWQKTLRIQKYIEKGGRLGRWLSEALYGFLFYPGSLIAFFNRKILSQHYEVTIDGKKVEGRFRAISIFNTAFYGGNKHPLSCALPVDGILDMLLTASGGILRTYSIFPLYIRGRFAEIPECSYHQARQIEIHSDTPLHIDLDTEVFFDNEFIMKLLPGALKFVDATGQGYQGECK